MFGSPPSPETLELTLFGPGYGESLLAHIGSGHWILVDSCIDSKSGRPAALAYLDQLGLDPADVVDMIVASHWHDDHVRGLSTILEACPRACFCLSSALTEREFAAMVSRFDLRNQLAGGSGVSELNRVYSLLQGRVAKRAIADRRLLTLSGGDLAHAGPVELWALSPSDRQVEKFLFGLASMMPNVGETKYRASVRNRNDLCVALWLSVGDNHILLGSDLEHACDADIGWKAVLSSTAKPQQRASVFKVPHHGSVTGHCPDVWDVMVTEESMALVTPFRKGRTSLPGRDDTARILSYTANAYITAAAQANTPRHRPPAVEKTLREMGMKLRPALPDTGALRLRKNLIDHCSEWQIEMFLGAQHLSEYQDGTG
ncbi:MAG: hypothetical protein C1943_14720 [Halochromatium sp.]|nr:hypothetical protein [Halochromatium sp.]